MKAPFRIDRRSSATGTLWAADDASLPVARHVASAETMRHAADVLPAEPGSVVRLTDMLFASRGSMGGILVWRT